MMTKRMKSHSETRKIVMDYKTLAGISLGILVIFFTGCTNTKLPPNKIYNLEISKDCCKNQFKKQKLTLKVLEPVANKHLNNTAIYYSDDKYRLQTYKLSRWSDFPTKMILEVITAKLDESNLYNNIITSYIYAASDYTLQSELLEFKQIINNKDSFVKLKIKFYLIQDDDRKNVISKIFNYTNRCDTIDAYGSVEAQNRSIEQLVKDLSIWLNKNTKE